MEISAIYDLLNAPRRLFPEERAEILFLLGRVRRLEKEVAAKEPEGFPVLKRSRSC